jgi:transcriptional regulator with XRE-family HTH domain
VTNLKRIRTAAGLSQSQLAEKADISLKTLQHYEQGTRDINKAQGILLYKIAQALNVKIEDVLDFRLPSGSCIKDGKLVVNDKSAEKAQ